jgi:hypothetical protein
MSLTTYAQLKTAVTSWLDITATDVSSQIDDLVTVAETRLFREARTRDMEVAMSTSIGSGVVAVPTGYIAWKSIYIDGSPTQRLERRTADWIYQRYPLRSADSKPSFIAREGTSFIFGPYPDSSYTVKGVYYKRLGTLSSTVNGLFVASPDLYLFACLAESEPLIGRDSRIKVWEEKYQRILNAVNGEDATENVSGGKLQMRVA